MLSNFWFWAVLAMAILILGPPWLYVLIRMIVTASHDGRFQSVRNHMKAMQKGKPDGIGNDPGTD